MLSEDGIKSHLDHPETRTLSKSSTRTLVDGQPLRMELFSPEQRRERGKIMAQEHHLAKKPLASDKLLERLRDNEETLRNVHRKFVDDVTAKKPVTAVGEWIVDNYYVIEEQISLAVRHLPKKYLLELPRLDNSGREGLPRVYDMAEHIIAYGDSRVDIEDVSIVVSAYQDVAPLKLGELWAVPIMLRLALIENIRRMAVLAEKCRSDRELARTWADEIIAVEERAPKNLVLAIADMARTNPRLTGPFVAEFKRKLQGRGVGMKLPLQWIEQNLNEQNRSVEQLVMDENHAQAVLEISMRNCINSLRNLNVTDWNEFVETMSLVEQTLRLDPADVYGKMDFNTRDDYRRAIETYARKSGRGELEIAAACLALSREALESGCDNASCHVGYYIVGGGERLLKKTIGYRDGLADYLRGASPRLTLAFYLGVIVVLTALFTAATVMLAHAGGVRGDMLIVLAVLLAFSTSHLAVGLVNLLSTQIVTPRPLPRINYAKGIPSEMRTLAVSPIIIGSAGQVKSLLATLESQYLNNRGRHIHFGLLTDFADAPTETTAGDDKVLNACVEGIERLNAKYPEDGGDNFFLFHRPRLWNDAEGVWMGRERKRGKLEDLNRYLLGTSRDAFSTIVGKTAILANIRYVITLDADTMMARDSAWQLVGAMAHPLNQPRYDAKVGRVVSGHGILQPRVDSRLSGANRSEYARMCATEIGIDPYTRSSSDVYQDLFDEGSFVGKGIYDVDAFDQALGGRFPDNKILSHDLLEGCVIRSGLLSDVKFYEDPPATYLMDMARRHRWVRGDWQIASYLVSHFRDDTQPLNLLSRWKIFDNLRRSLTPVFLLLLLVLALTVLTNPGLYLLTVVGVFVLPVLVAGACGLARFSPEKTIRQHVRNSLRDTLRQAGQMLFKFSCLPFEAYVNVDAIVRSLWRQCVSHKLLLQWKPADNSQKDTLVEFAPIMRRMWIGPVAALVMMAVLSVSNRDIHIYAAPLFFLWLLSPWFAHLLSVPRRPDLETLSEKQAAFLRCAARRIWLFFEDFVTAEDNWLPPDNHQEYPVARTAHRTSPTNMGLSLLANLSAMDFGYISAERVVERTQASLTVMHSLERYRGHFYNWYDTRTLKVLRPAYVSTVDSGNLAAHLLVLASGLRGLDSEPVVHARFFAGLADTLGLAVTDAESASEPLLLDVAALQRRAEDLAVRPAASLAGYWRTTAEFVAATADLAARWRDRDGGDGPCANGKTGRWLTAAAEQAKDALEEIRRLAPWAEGLAALPEADLPPEADRVRTLADTARLAESLPDGPLAVYSDAMRTAANVAAERQRRIRRLCALCEELADIDYAFLYDKSKRLLAIGYHVDERRLDNSYYDLLASEARLAVYLAVAQHKISQNGWFALGRLLTLSGRLPLLISWSGSMFEYLMPLLVMPTFEDTLLDETYRACVSVQMEYAEARGVPWGISESGYYVFDSEQNYQYRAFGVPELGLKHGLSEDLVIAPYAAMLAAMVFPERAARNLQRLAADGFQAMHGFYEAVDYTPSRLSHNASRAVVRSFMAHHQGMSLVALGQALLGRPMHKRFAANPQLESCIMLLQEMAPTEKALYYHSTYSPEIHTQVAGDETPVRVVNNPSSPHPEVQLLSNGSYHVMVTAAGGGYSRWRDYSVTRWREDATRDNWGSFCYIRDVKKKTVWSTAYQPVRTPAKHFEAVFSEGRAEFRRQDEDFHTRAEIVVSSEDDVEVRRIRITNRAAEARMLDVTSYSEIALAQQAADDSHQAFSKLFVQTRIVPERQAIVCSRRPREPEEKNPLVFHMLAVRGTTGGKVTYETDRLRFLGRDNDASRPEAVFGGIRELSNSEGAVLDPVAAIRSEVYLESGATVTVDLVTGVGESEERVAELLEKYQDQRLAEKAFDLAWSHGQLILRQLDISETEAQRFCQLAGSMLYVNPQMRAEPAVIMRNRKGQSGLWGYAISGDLPILLLKIAEPSRLQLVKQMIQAHTYWRQKGLQADLVIWNEDQTSYRQTLHDQIMSLAGAVLEDGAMEQPGGIFLRSTDRIAEEDRVLIQTAARVVMSDVDGMLDEQLRKLAKSDPALADTVVQYPEGRESPGEPDPEPVGDLMFENGFGGFSPDGEEYVVVMDDGVSTPLPWVNVIANEEFGTVVSASGSSYTWSENAHEFRLTPWENDPVSDSGGEALYLRDEQTGAFWSPAPYPCRGGHQYVARHGFGYTSFEHSQHGIHTTLTVHVDRDAPVKFLTLQVVNKTGARRTLSATAYMEWVLGDIRSKTEMHVVTGVDSRSGALFARNQYNDEFRGRTAFLDVDDPARTVTGDRREFLGRNGSLASPMAMKRPILSGRVGPGLDPCGAVRTRFSLGPGQERTLVFRIGVAQSVDEARSMIRHFRGSEAATASRENALDFWRGMLGTLRVETPDPAFNFMANGWLLYQALSCRFWGRSATYQSGGAFGFRDQLQDSMALLYSCPHLVRAHILECAGRQFREGDVQHWWHPPSGRGVRTQCSDDYLWLPFVAERYVTVTGDRSVLDEKVRFIKGRPLREDEESYYDMPQRSEEKATLYEHCKRSIRHGLRFGFHGLPLIGSGDWNDGMDRIGRGGKGESVWLGFFLHETLTRFAPIAEDRDDDEFAQRCREEASRLAANIEQNAWDGEWYRRAYFDDGTPLGSTSNPECSIDSLAQSWAVLSGVAAPERAERAMAAVDSRLVDRPDKLIRLFAPPFDASALNPGYIKGYVPGVRENGGQYTHAAIWTAMAYARLRDRELAWEMQELLNPINHALTREWAERYKVEPYVVSADVYTNPMHAGRGGWSWYTGSASWLYRFMVESILGFTLEAGVLKLSPCIPETWDGFRIRYRVGESAYDIHVSRAEKGGVADDGRAIALRDDASEHVVELRL